MSGTLLRVVRLLRLGVRRAESQAAGVAPLKGVRFTPAHLELLIGCLLSVGVIGERCLQRGCGGG